MEKLILILLAKYKIFIYWFITGTLIQWFEIKAGNLKFNLGNFIISSVIFGLLCEVSAIFIQGFFAEANSDEHFISLSVSLAFVLYLIIPFIFKKENRGAFIESILNRFWFERIKTEVDKELQIFK